MQPFFFIRHEGRFVKVDLQQIIYIESRKNYTRLVLEERPPAQVLVTLKQWDRMLPRDLFCRIHRGYIISIGKLVAFDTKYVYLPAGEKIAIGDQYRNALPDAVTILANEPFHREHGRSADQDIHPLHHNVLSRQDVLSHQDALSRQDVLSELEL